MLFILRTLKYQSSVLLYLHIRIQTDHIPEREYISYVKNTWAIITKRILI